MTFASIPVDLLNPGQVFACLGFMELSEVLLGPVEAGFDWSDPSGIRFCLRAAGEENPIAVALRFLADAEVQSLALPDSDLSTEKWDVASGTVPAGEPFPIPPPRSPASLPAVLTAKGRSVTICSWGEVNLSDALGTRRDNVKFWAGAAGYPGVGLLRDALEAVRPFLADAGSTPFSLSAPQSSSFRFDWRRDYIPIDIGFSLNEHGRMRPLGYPLVEILAVIGLSNARPQRIEKLKYRYAVVGRGNEHAPEQTYLLPAPLLRAALGAVHLPFDMRTFTMNLSWPGQENQARCITTVYEETA